MKHIALIIFVFIVASCAQVTPVQNLPQSTPPKLVVGIVVDQMRYDLLHRFQDKFGEGGFKRMINQGFSCEFNQYHYASTVTGPGHAHVHTGSVPAISGIVGNGWFEKNGAKEMYVVQDDSVEPVGAEGDREGKMSPRNMKVSTIADQLMIHSQFKSKVVGVAIKDRGAILPAGHTGKAFWYSSSTGNWITSSYYSSQLPGWVEQFNSEKRAEGYAKSEWLPYSDASAYIESEEDDQPYENRLAGEEKAVFPHRFSSSGIATTPFGNTLTLDFALKALESEQLGQDLSTDFLAISFSSPDYVGHSFGPQSKEIEDTYIRLDKELERLFNILDEKVGVNEYMVFLSADHGVAEIPAFLKKHEVPAGVFLGREILDPLKSALKEKFGEGDFILAEDNYQLYLNHNLLAEKNLNKLDILEVAKATLEPMEGVFKVIDLEEVADENLPSYYKELLLNLYHPKRSGELMLLVEPAWFIGYTRGTTHGTMYSYDTHVPLLFFGKNIPHGKTSRPTFIKDIAPTVSQYLGILEPNGSVGSPIFEVLRK